MATTPNYGWVTPAPTDFVTDLPADFETFADAVDDTVKDLNPGTTAGDLDYYTSSTAKARLGIGTAGQVLTVNSGATAPEWQTSASGGMTLLTSGTLTSGVSSVTFSFTTTGYNEIWAYIRNGQPAATNRSIAVRPNSNSTSNNYRGLYNRWDGSTYSDGGLSTGDTWLNLAGGSNTAWDNNFHSTIRISNLYDASYNPNGWLLFDAITGHATSGEGAAVSTRAFVKNNNVALTGLTFFISGGGNFAGGRVEIWGIK